MKRNLNLKIKKHLRIRHTIGPGWFLLPSLTGVLLFFMIPFIVIGYYSLINNTVQKKFVFLDNFKSLLNNDAFMLASKNTLHFSIIAVPLAVFLALGLSLLLDRSIPGKSKFRTCFLSPMMVPVASVILVWQVLFHESGQMSQFLSLFGIEPIAWLKSEYAQIAVVILFLWKNLGYNMILFLAALSNIPKDLLEVAQMERTGAFRTFYKIKLPFLSPTLLFVTLLSLINSFKVFREVHLLAGDYPHESLYMIQHFMNNTFRSLDYQKLASAAVMMAIVLVCVILVLFVCENHFGKDVEG